MAVSFLRLVLAARLLAGPALAFRSRKPDAGKRLSAALERLGPPYVKLGQMLATRPDIVGAEVAVALEHLQDRLPPGAATTPHYHPRTEEIYYILRGEGLMQIDHERRQVGPGDAIAIPPGCKHQITNTGTETLVFLCCCAPPYRHEDTYFE